MLADLQLLLLHLILLILLILLVLLVNGVLADAMMVDLAFVSSKAIVIEFWDLGTGKHTLGCPGLEVIVLPVVTRVSHTRVMRSNPRLDAAQSAVSATFS